MKEKKNKCLNEMIKWEMREIVRERETEKKKRRRVVWKEYCRYEIRDGIRKSGNIVMNERLDVQSSRDNDNRTPE